MSTRDAQTSATSRFIESVSQFIAVSSPNRLLPVSIKHSQRPVLLPWLPVCSKARDKQLERRTERHTVPVSDKPDCFSEIIIKVMMIMTTRASPETKRVHLVSARASGRLACWHRRQHCSPNKVARAAWPRKNPFPALSGDNSPGSHNRTDERSLAGRPL